MLFFLQINTEHTSSALESNEISLTQKPNQTKSKQINPVLKRKSNFCIECKKLVKEFCKHYEKAHKNTPEGKRLNEINLLADAKEKKRLKTEITDLLRKKGNAEYCESSANEQFKQGGNAVIVPVKRSAKEEFHQGNSVQCAHCQGYYKRRKFSQHLKLCKQYQKECNSSEASGQRAVQNDSLPVIKSVDGASTKLVNEVIRKMRPSEIKDNALRDPLIMQYVSSLYKTRCNTFQHSYMSRVILDLARVVKRMQELNGEKITCLEDVFSPVHFSTLVECVLLEGGYDPEKNTVEVCGLNNRLRSHLKGAAEYAEQAAKVKEHVENTPEKKLKRKQIKHFLDTLEKQWANEAGRIFDHSAKKSLAEKDKKLAAEEDIVKTCQYVNSEYRKTIKALDNSPNNTLEKKTTYNHLLDLIVTHIMCLIRRRPVDFKRGLNSHYEKMDTQDDLLAEVKNSKHMNISENDLNICNKFKLFYVPGKGWKEMVSCFIKILQKLIVTYRSLCMVFAVKNKSVTLLKAGFLLMATLIVSQ